MGRTRAGKPAVMPVGTAAPPELLDVVYVVRPGDDNENLRYSLRSLSNLAHGKVYIVGYKPAWVKNVIYLPTEQENNPDQENSNFNLKVATGTVGMSANFIFMNDDFFIMHRVDAIQPAHQGSLDERIDNYKTGHRLHQAFSLITTREELEKLVPNQQLYSYELHVPMVFNRAKLRRAFELWPRPLLSLRPRTFYGNLYAIEGEKTADAKEASWQDSRQNSEFYSTTGRPDSPSAGDWSQLRSRFTTASIYESAD